MGQPPPYLNKIALGEALFFDVNLSKNRTQSCATCHAPDRAFIDPRGNAPGKAVSLGDDSISLGVRNAPTLTYAALTPAFHLNAQGDFLGGLFYDGRAADLGEQAAAPLINPLEMALADADMISLRVQDNPAYVTAMKNLYNEHPQIVKDMAALLQKYIDNGRSTPGAIQQNEGETNIFRGIPKGKTL